MDSVTIELEKAVADPDTVIEAGYAPSPFIFGFEPPENDQGREKAFSQLLGVSSLVRMFAALNIVAARALRKQDEPYSLADHAEYVAAFNEDAEATAKALTAGPLAELYDSSTGGSTQTEEVLLKRSELHSFVLPRIFGGLSCVTKQGMKDLDTVLTNFVAALKPYSGAPVADQPALKHVVLVNYVRATDIIGDGTNLVIDPYTRFVSLTINTEGWFKALQKPGFFSRNEKIKFSMTTTITEMKLDGGKYEANKPKYEQGLGIMVGEQDELKRIVTQGGLEGFGRETSGVMPAA